MKTRLFLFLWIILGLSAVVFSFVSAQSGDCGNGLVQQLYIGATGWVIPEPPQAVNVRDVPGGNRIGQLQPGEEFTVLDGPECSDSYSWWLVEGGTVSGWISEGVDNYFVEPLASGSAGTASNNYSVIIENTDCTGDSAFSVGQAVEVRSSSPSIFYGHPLLENNLFDLSVMNSFYYNQSFELNTSYASVHQPNLEGRWYLMEGPYCVNGDYLWKLGREGSINQGMPYRISSEIPYWFYESALGETANIVSVPAFTPSFDELSLSPDTAPLINPNQQVAFEGFGGGGEAFPIYWYIQGCLLAEHFSAIAYESILAHAGTIYNNDFTYLPNCLEIYPIQSDTVQVKIYQPDGSLYQEMTLAPEPLIIEREVEASNIIQIDTNSVSVMLPDDVGLMTGIWRLEVVDDDSMRQYAYHLIPDDFMRLQSYCDQASLSFWVNGFEPNHPLDIVFVGISSEFRIGIDEREVADFQELARWSVETNSSGNLILQTAFIPEGEGYLVVVETGMDWRERLDFVGNYHPGLFASPLIITCPEIEGSRPIEANRLSLGAGSYQFTANRNDVVTISSMVYRNLRWQEANLNSHLELYAPDGRLLAENDEAENPELDVIDAALENLVLPETGIYTLVVATEGDQGQVAFYMDMETSTLSSEDINITLGESVVTNLAESSQWVFEASADDLIQISVVSSDFDPLVRLVSTTGEVLVEDDDSGEALNASLEFTVQQTGIYIIEISSWNEKTGEYTLEIRQ